MQNHQVFRKIAMKLTPFGMADSFGEKGVVNLPRAPFKLIHIIIISILQE